MSETIELLTIGDDGHVIEGPKYPIDLSTVIYAVDDDGDYEIGHQRLAYPHKFFCYDEHGQPMPDTLVRFLVPDHLCRDGFPTRMACDIVAERMGWTAHEEEAG